MVASERRAVVIALIAEKRAKLVDPSAFLDQNHPVVVAAFVAQMPEQRTIGFAELLALAFALDRVGFSDVDRHDAVEVTGQRVANEIEGQRAFRRSRSIKWQPKSEERVDEALSWRAPSRARLRGRQARRGSGSFG